MANILILEDEKVLSDGIRISLEKDGHTVSQAFCCRDAEVRIEKAFDLYLLDIRLPDGSGLDICREIRKRHTAPVVFLTANDTESDMLRGFAVGCDDYIAKPFSLAVLTKKVAAVLRLAGEAQNRKLFRHKDLTVDYDKMTATVDGRDCNLTATEYRLLEYMVRNSGKVLTRSMLLENIWDIDGDFIDENTLSVHIRRLRGKLERDAKNPEYIKTVFGIGYCFGG